MRIPIRLHLIESADQERLDERKLPLGHGSKVRAQNLELLLHDVAICGDQPRLDVPFADDPQEIRMLALMAQDAAGGDLLAIRTEKIYPAEYVPTTQEARAEFDADEFPALKEIAVNPEDYDTIILIFPLWWDRTPMAVASFLRPYDLSGKRIIPIVTHGGGGLGAAVETLRTYTNADVREGLNVYSSDVPSARQTIADYLKKNANE